MKLVNFESIKTTKIAILGDVAKAKKIWIVLHGYGQLVQFFIRKFRVLEELGIAVIAPEAQSRFYIQGFSGRVGATWMTKEEREEDIKDYINYLNAVYKEFKLDNKEIILLGFSQGGATASRWFSKYSHLFSQLILWASVFPDDFEIKELENEKCIVVMGNNDPLMKNEKEKMKREEKMKSIKIVDFSGGHDIDSETLKNLL